MALMRRRLWVKYLSHWLRAVIHDLTGAAFGWGAAIAALFVAAIPGLNIPQKLGLMTGSEQLPWWFSPLASAAFAILIVAAFRILFIAPYRACRMLKPFRVKLISGEIETAYPKERFERQNVAVSIENRSYRDLVNCTLYVTKVSGFNDDHHQFPRLIQEFSIQSGDTIVIPILSRTLRTAPLQSDKHLTFHGPIAPVWNGNIVTLPIGSYDMEIRIGVPDGNAVLIPCMIQSDDSNLNIRRSVKPELREAIGRALDDLVV
ncbi:MAG TPA: hypothetical protein VJY15_09960 [Candidatus Acidoferrum sp.]|nr:hypothetical protein [Candidatus Acidoferrum sp.]